jgi:DNA-binding transcriptional LysR family regulator
MGAMSEDLQELSGLRVFAVVAEERSFTRAAGRLGMSSSAVSHTVSTLEKRIGLRLLARTTRSVSTTAAGDQLLRAVGPALTDIAEGIAAVRSSHGKPAGTIRITAVKNAVRRVLWPVLADFKQGFPDIRIEVDADDGLTDLVAQRYDGGLRFSGSVAKDLVAMRVSTELRGAVVASPAYFRRCGVPATPQDLFNHDCITHRKTGRDEVYPWTFMDGDTSYAQMMTGTVALNDADLVIEAALAGIGIAYVFEDEVAAQLASGKLERVLAGSSVRFPGYDFYYSNRRQNTPALVAFIEHLRGAYSPALGEGAAL